MYSKWQAESENCMLVVNVCVMHSVAFKACRLNIVESAFTKDSLIIKKLVHGLIRTMQNMAVNWHTHKFKQSICKQSMKCKLCNDLINTTPTKHKKATIQYVADQTEYIFKQD